MSIFRSRFEDKNFYERLQVSVDASAEEIRTAFYLLAIAYHPECGQIIKSNPEQAEHYREVFVLITEAYNVLKNERKRLLYNQTLPNNYLAATQDCWVKVRSEETRQEAATRQRAKMRCVQIQTAAKTRPPDRTR